MYFLVSRANWIGFVISFSVYILRSTRQRPNGGQCRACARYDGRIETAVVKVDRTFPLASRCDDGAKRCGEPDSRENKALALKPAIRGIAQPAIRAQL